MRYSKSELHKLSSPKGLVYLLSTDPPDIPAVLKRLKYDAALKKLSEHLIPVIVLPDLQYSKLGHAFKDFKGKTLLYLNDPNANTMNLFLKRKNFTMKNF